ncbi:hypothetical protein [Aquimarina sp. MMG016]|uniref:hypothetical protein n=1 Tax=Aquimarina sp. MMG016 TaxID=2822690 RepID=UPI001B3A7B1D|nr:hypothetical protein [Aquimarina sp. MMG016]MBQ4818589.1 hypothetical protein [Aquimarina sp. MMG016]
MSYTIIFKRLFEVHILHDYFLTTADGVSFFNKNEAEKENLITKKLDLDAYDVKNLFEIEPVGSTKQVLSNYKLVTAKTSLGFMVGVQITVENKLGVTLYKPNLKIDDDVNLTFSVKPSASFFKSITNISLRSSLPSIYYFTNKDKQVFDETTVPAYTSLPISNQAIVHEDGRLYEMGALIDFSGTIREAVQYTDGSDANHWVDIDDKRYVNDADRILLPHEFAYRFQLTQNATDVEFVLLDQSDNEIKTITKTNPAEILDSVLLNFVKVDENDNMSDDIPSGFYKLKVRINGGPEIVHSIYLNNDLYDKNYFAIIDIRMDEKDSPFSLIDNEGFLKTRIDAADQKIKHPVFEIRFKNRSTYWRYNKEGDFSPAEVTATSSFLDHEPEKLISQKPKALTAALVPFQNGSSLMLPHPRMPSIKVEKDRIFSEIFINQSNRLLNN